MTKPACFRRLLSFCQCTLSKRDKFMTDDSNNDATDPSRANDLIEAVPDTTHSEQDNEWGAPLWDDSWEGQTGLFGDAHLCVATKKWGDGTVDVLIAHDPYADAGIPTVYEHRHGTNVTPFTIQGPANEVIKTVTQVWGPPQERETESLES